MFNANFGFGNFSRNNSTQTERGPQKNKETIFNLKVSLKEVFTGRKKKLKVTKKIIKNKSTQEPVETDLERTWDKCSNCKGQGVIIEGKQIGPGMFTQMQNICPSCSGKRFSLLNNFEIRETSIIIEINIEKGVKNNTHIKIPNQGNVIPGTYPGDLKIVLSVNNSEREFRRKDNDLIYEKKILLSEALTGSSFKIKHLDDRNLYISFSSAFPGEKKIIKGEGVKGDLIILFDVVFPTSLNKEKKREIRKLLPFPQDKIRKDEKDIHFNLE